MENKQIKFEYRRQMLDLLNDYPYPEWYERQDIRKKVERLGTLLGNNKMDKCHPLKSGSIQVLTTQHIHDLLELGYTKKHICQAAGISKHEFSKLKITRKE
ncbi:hypothetical protein F6X86_13645 [Enterococcus durans]|uniref:Uncharacterized protein n=1 Tax=Enterococcus durans TaxID=53345 RepID=A0A5N0YN85_9ENTE|nr:hypothetical protein [Enterococcus durans]KAA9176692.1 hypothetical protein F6X86_13645 [Enterococcus durans]KAA9182224.1 hypothetical protein F6X85_13910 [Enterococcus durans]KAA9183435.1 hypothetical protein F6X90_13870 [Enterococcus durans]KAA9187613.1 hypothetical protein F6Y12_13890 [Enterococcus durans]KAA9190054.1 hypothetical protein F6X88_13790 [Enterococcus durans]